MYIAWKWRPNLRWDCDPALPRSTRSVLSRLWKWRPNLRWDCDKNGYCYVAGLPYTAGGNEDLIWGGIVTRWTIIAAFSASSSGNEDLIWGGIVTGFVIGFLWCPNHASWKWRPNLRWDCDRTLSSFFSFEGSIESGNEDLIWGGIVTISSPFRASQNRKWKWRPNLRWDCDRERRSNWLAIPTTAGGNEDLIWGGIVTQKGLEGDPRKKNKGWKWRPNLRWDCDEIDPASWFVSIVWKWRPNLRWDCDLRKLFLRRLMSKVLGGNEDLIWGGIVTKLVPKLQHQVVVRGNEDLIWGGIVT